MKKSMRETVIRTKKISKDYRIFKSNLQRVGAELFGRKKGILKHALNEVSFTVKRGERIAILGNIGSGRSTLLRILAGITYPSSGELFVGDKVTYIMDLRAGFDNELTGRENIRARCISLGWTKAEMKANEEWIIEFAEIEEFVDHQMKTYTSGMAGRLGLAISMALIPEIILVDELSNVGGKHYKAKCIEKLREIAQIPEVTMIYVSSVPSVPINLCRRGMVIDEGQIKFDGTIKDAIAFFREYYFMGSAQYDDNLLGDNDDDSDYDDMDV